jgi:hypothetical protein
MTSSVSMITNLPRCTQGPRAKAKQAAAAAARGREPEDRGRAEAGRRTVAALNPRIAPPRTTTSHESSYYALAAALQREEPLGRGRDGRIDGAHGGLEL